MNMNKYVTKSDLEFSFVVCAVAAVLFALLVIGTAVAKGPSSRIGKGIVVEACGGTMQVMVAGFCDKRLDGKVFTFNRKNNATEGMSCRVLLRANGRVLVCGKPSYKWLTTNQGEVLIS